jgi:recombinational DNA repair protein RecT
MYLLLVSCGKELMYYNKNDYPIEVKVYYKNSNCHKVQLNKYKSYFSKVKMLSPQRRGTYWSKKQIEEHIKSIDRIDIISIGDSVSIIKKPKIKTFLRKGIY